MKLHVDLEQINFLDERFYTDDGERFVPSVTYILESYPKGAGFTRWLKDMGSNADQVVERAAAVGTKVHNAIEKLLLGEEIEWDGENYDLDIWIYILRFAEFWKTYKPKLISTEEAFLDHELGYGGTLDLVCEIKGDRWLIDLKTSNAIYNSYELQVAAYRKLYEKATGTKIDRAGIFWFKARTRGADKKGKKIQGEGWQLVEYERDWFQAYDLFEAVHRIWKHENPNAKPKNRVYPISVKL